MAERTENMSRFHIEKASTLQAALKLLRTCALAPIAGATDVMPSLQNGKRKANRFVDVFDLQELRGIEENEDTLIIGAAVPVGELILNRSVQKRLPLLCEACSHIASPQIRSRATLGGNTANASPSADGTNALFALEARAILTSLDADGELSRRKLEMPQLLLGVNKTALRVGEIIEAFEIPAYPCEYSFEKVGLRNSMAISVASLCMTHRREGERHILRASLGAVAPVIRRCEKAEAKIADAKTIDDALIEEIIAMYMECVTPIDDIRASAEYRKAVMERLLRDKLRKLLLQEEEEVCARE